MKKRLLYHPLFIIFFIINILQASCQPVTITKTNPTKVYVHYMPWFTAPENPGSGVTSFPYGVTGIYNEWGAHWSQVNSNSANPNTFTTVTDYTGAQVQTRNICAHYHPLIGPYDGQDSTVIEYHLLLMKLSGIDGVLIDWYGQAGQGAADAGPLLINTNAVVARMARAGLKYGLILEDAAWNGTSGAQSNGNYAVSNYFTDPNYITLGDMRGSGATNAGSPLVGVFGPQQFKTSAAWNTILSNNTGAFLTLYNQSGPIKPAAAGEFAWPYPQAGQSGTPPAWYANLNTYYTSQASAINIVLGAAFPGFSDFYGTNGASQYRVIPRTYNSTTTLSAMLSLYNQNKSVLDGLQLVTWNDFSEGTIIEPTVEEGFQSLDSIQSFTGVQYTEADLQQVYRFFTLRKKYFGNSAKQLQLNQVFNYFASLQISNAVSLMNTIDNVVLPVKLLSFYALPQANNSNLLYWNTANETNIQSFIIEQSNDDINFISLAKIPAKDETSNSYTYNVGINSSTNYYRLKMVDNMGQYIYSSILTIRNSENDTKGIVVFPNPGNTWVNIKVIATSLMNTCARIINDAGVVVKIFIIQDNLQTIDISSLLPGLYYIQTKLGSKKIIIDR